jgi:hypothetical protein
MQPIVGISANPLKRRAFPAARLPVRATKYSAAAGVRHGRGVQCEKKKIFFEIL